MCYPTLEQVKRAGLAQLGEWVVRLPHPEERWANDRCRVARELFILRLIIRKYFCLTDRRYKQRSTTLKTHP